MREGKPKKIMVRMLVGIGIFLILLSTLVLLLPHIINLGPVKERILIYLSQMVGGRVNFQKVDISNFPHSLVVIHQPSLSIPEKATGTLVSATVFPEVLSFHLFHLLSDCHHTDTFLNRP